MRRMILDCRPRKLSLVEHIGVDDVPQLGEEDNEGGAKERDQDADKFDSTGKPITIQWIKPSQKRKIN